MKEKIIYIAIDGKEFTSKEEAEEYEKEMENFNYRKAYLELKAEIESLRNLYINKYNPWDKYFPPKETNPWEQPIVQYTTNNETK